MNKISKTTKKFTISIVLLIAFIAFFTVTTFAFVYSLVSVESNLFKTGVVQINLNDGNTVVNKDDRLFEPGATIKKDFFIENQSTCDVYYKIYFQNVEGILADVLEVEIYDGDTLLVSGTPSELTRENVSGFEKELKIGERKNLQICFYFPEYANNISQGEHLYFDLAADAVQTKNNPEKSFD